MTEYTITDDIEACRNLRKTVFIDEQSVPEADEWDDLDDTAIHLLAYVEGSPVGTARILIEDDMAKIGRVCVLPEARGLGIGRGLMQLAADHLAKRGDIQRAKLGAQTHALGFYEALGYTAEGPEYNEAGIPHRDMWRDI